MEVVKVARRPGDVAPRENDNIAPTNQVTRKNSQDEGPDPHAIGTKLGSYVFDKSLGKGTFGKVKLATHTLTNEHVSKMSDLIFVGCNQNTRKSPHKG